MKKRVTSSLNEKGKRGALLIPLVATALILAACGGNNPTSSEASSQASSAATTSTPATTSEAGTSTSATTSEQGESSDPATTSQEGTSQEGTTSEESSVPAPSISIADGEGKKESNIDINGTLTLVVTIENTSGNVQLTSSNPEVASVDENGVVTGLKTGDATITASVDGVSDTYLVHVNAIEISVTVANVVFVGRTERITVSATGITGNYGVGIGTEDVDTIEIGQDEQGFFVKGLAAGTAKFVVEIEGATNEVTINVAEVPLEGIAFAQGEAAEVGLRDTLTLDVVANPEDAKLGTVTFSSDDNSVAIVDENGVVTPVNVGTATITATAGEKTATCAITVIPPVIEAAKLNVPAAYKLEATSVEYVDPVHEGLTQADPLSFDPNENGIFEIDVAAVTGMATRYVKFHIDQAGKYRLYNTGLKNDTDTKGIDGKLNSLQKYDAEGNLGTSLGSIDDIGANKNEYAIGTENFYIEFDLEEGDYLASINRYGGSAGFNVFFGISNVAEGEADNTIFASKPDEEKIAQEKKGSMQLVPGVGLAAYGQVFILNEGNIYETKQVEGVYQALKSDTPIGTYEEGVCIFDEEVVHLGLETIALTQYDYQGSLGNSDYFYLPINGENVNSFAYNVAEAMGFLGDVQGIYVVLDADGELQKMTFDSANVEIQDFDITITETLEFDYDVALLDVGNGGQFDGEGGANQDW